MTRPTPGTDGPESVVLVDADDRPVGTAEKLAAHERGQLHRAFSIFIFNHAGQLLLQRRAPDKYHSGGLWTNTCCGHPRPGETTGASAERRLTEEMGFTSSLRHVATFTYRAALDRHLTEHEIDHVFVGRFDGVPLPNPNEVAAWRWMHRPELDREMQSAPATFTAWLAPALDALDGVAGWPDLPAQPIHQ